MNIQKIIHKAKDFYTGEWFMYESLRYGVETKYSMPKQTRVQSFVVQYRRAYKIRNLVK